MRSLLAILLVVVVGLAAAQMVGDEAVPPAAANYDHESIDAAAVPATANSSIDDGGTSRPSREGPNAPSRAPVDSAKLGLFGTALDDRDQPLAGLTIRLLAERARDHEAKWAKTDAAGQFVFADVHGTFDCTIWDFVRVTEKVTIANGKHKDIVLKIKEPCVLVTGTVRAGARLIADRTVGVHGKDGRGDVHHDAHTDEHGVYRHLLRPGSYEISVVGPPTSIAWGIKGTTVWAETATQAMVKEPITLAAVPARVRRDFMLPSAVLNVRVQNHNCKPIGDASITIRSTEHESRTWTRRTDESDGTITFEELPAGNWEVTVMHEMHLPTEPHLVTTRSGDGAQTITIIMVPAGSALVKFTRNGDLHEPLDASMLELHVAGQKPMRGGRKEGAMWIYKGTQFDAVPTGTHELHCKDVPKPDGSIRFAPIEPISPQRITIEPGKTVETTIAIVPRPHLAVAVVGGSEMDTSIEVISSRGRVVPSRHGHDHWRAEVPAGVYTVKVKRGDLEHSDQVSVFQTEVEHIVRLGSY